MVLLIEASLAGGLNRARLCWAAMRPGTTIVIISLLAMILIAAVIQIGQIMAS